MSQEDKKRGMGHRILAITIVMAALFLTWGLVTVAAIPPGDEFPAELASREPTEAGNTAYESPPPAVTGSNLVPIIAPAPQIEAMLGQVVSATLYQYVGDLSGEWPVTVGGEPYTLTTRHTYSGEPILRATQFISEHLVTLGLEVNYHYWGQALPPNVIGELSGERHPEEIVLLSAHLDSLNNRKPPAEIAPGADDNASGTATVLLAADILSGYRWGCTLRFALWTGEEQGLLGSDAYAQRASASGEQIAGVLNLDMLAWDGIAGPDIDLHANQTDVPPSMELAELFSDVVQAYDLNLVPEIIPNGMDRSDHVSFWHQGYAAILGIEDYYPDAHDFNPYYHSNEDRLQRLNLEYFTEFAKASLGTFAHMGCLLPHGTLIGQVTHAGTGAPIGNARLVLRDRGGYTYSTRTDSTGRYAQTMVAETYTVTVSAHGLGPITAAGVGVVTDTVSVRDFALHPGWAVYLPLLVRR